MTVIIVFFLCLVNYDKEGQYQDFGGRLVSTSLLVADVKHIVVALGCGISALVTKLSHRNKA
jgi:hypothetical protein